MCVVPRVTPVYIFPLWYYLHSTPQNLVLVLYTVFLNTEGQPRWIGRWNKWLKIFFEIYFSFWRLTTTLCVFVPRVRIVCLVWYLHLRGGAASWVWLSLTLNLHVQCSDVQCCEVCGAVCSVPCTAAAVCQLEYDSQGVNMSPRPPSEKIFELSKNIWQNSRLHHPDDAVVGGDPGAGGGVAGLGGGGPGQEGAQGPQERQEPRPRRQHPGQARPGRDGRGSAAQHFLQPTQVQISLLPQRWKGNNLVLVPLLTIILEFLFPLVWPVSWLNYLNRKNTSCYAHAPLCWKHNKVDTTNRCEALKEIMSSNYV